MATNIALKVAIIERDTTQSRVADAVGMTESMFSRIISGRRDASEDEKKAIAKALRRKVHELFPEAVTA